MKLLSLIFCFIFTFSAIVPTPTLAAEENQDTSSSSSLLEKLPTAPEISAPSAILYEANTGTVLYEKNSTEARAPASVTKIMTLLLVSEAIEEGRIKLDDEVIISENAASMGGSQVFLKEGEQMSVEELLKCAVIASANDASVALAEYVAGSEESFVLRMNERAKELSLQGCTFENTTGLDDTVTNHTMSAQDIAVLSSMLIRYDFITKYSSLWQDSIRDGAFTLTNTNRLVRYYDGCNGLKTGSTEKAGYCVSVSAKRANVSLICVIMGAESRESRNECARTLLDYGFASVALYCSEEASLESIPVYRSKTTSLWVKEDAFCMLVEKGMEKKVEKIYEIPQHLVAPLCDGDVVGKVSYYLNGELLGEGALTVEGEAKVLTFFDTLLCLLTALTCGARTE